MTCASLVTSPRVTEGFVSGFSLSAFSEELGLSSVSSGCARVGAERRAKRSAVRTGLSIGGAPGGADDANACAAGVPVDMLRYGRRPPHFLHRVPGLHGDPLCDAGGVLCADHRVVC